MSLLRETNTEHRIRHSSNTHGWHLLKLRKTLPHSAGNVRKGAVSGEGVVQPLP